MSEGEESRKPFSYNFRTSGQMEQERRRPGTDQGSLISIRDTLLLLTGECEIVQRQDGVFCEKHGRPVIEGGTRCDYLASRFARREGERQSKAQVQQYINEVLGVKDPGVASRLSGPE